MSMFWSKLCKWNRNCAWNLAFISCIYLTYCMEYMWTSSFNYESLYFKELHKEQEYYWPTIYRAGASVVSTITSKWLETGISTLKILLFLTHLRSRYPFLYYITCTQGIFHDIACFCRYVQRVWMGLTDNWQMAKILTDNWQIPENVTDYWHPWVLLSTDKGTDCPLFSTKPVFKALNSIVPLFFH